MCQRISLHDRLAWNEGKWGQLEHLSLNDFGSWLCHRATAYQNAHCIAADQTTSFTKNNADTRCDFRRNARTIKERREPDLSKNIPANHFASSAKRIIGSSSATSLRSSPSGREYLSASVIIFAFSVLAPSTSWVIALSRSRANMKTADILITNCYTTPTSFQSGRLNLHQLNLGDKVSTSG